MRAGRSAIQKVDGAQTARTGFPCGEANDEFAVGFDLEPAGYSRRGGVCQLNESGFVPRGACGPGQQQPMLDLLDAGPAMPRRAAETFERPAGPAPSTSNPLEPLPDHRVASFGRRPPIRSRAATGATRPGKARGLQPRGLDPVCVSLRVSVRTCPKATFRLRKGTAPFSPRENRDSPQLVVVQPLSQSPPPWRFASAPANWRNSG